jgi:hypothetical protein
MASNEDDRQVRAEIVLLPLNLELHLHRRLAADFLQVLDR